MRPNSVLTCHNDIIRIFTYCSIKFMLRSITFCRMLYYVAIYVCMLCSSLLNGGVTAVVHTTVDAYTTNDHSMIILKGL